MEKTQARRELLEAYSEYLEAIDKILIRNKKREERHLKIMALIKIMAAALFIPTVSALIVLAAGG